jgi:hypothetical protein
VKLREKEFSMSFSCYAINKEDEFSVSWWQWMPLWNYIATQSAPFKPDYGDGLTNDLRFLDVDTTLKAVASATATAINLEWIANGAANCQGRMSALRFLSSKVEHYSLSPDILEGFIAFLQRNTNHNKIVIGG